MDARSTDAFSFGVAPARALRRQESAEQAFPEDSAKWRRIMLQSQLDLAALFIATGRNSFEDSRRKDYEFSRDRAAAILREAEAEIRALGDQNEEQLSAQLRQLQAQADALTSLEKDRA